MRVLSAETQERVSQLQENLRLFDHRTYGMSEDVSPHARMLHAPYNEFVDHMYEQNPPVDGRKMITQMTIPRVRVLFTFYRTFLGILASYATECTDKTVRDKSKVIVTHLRRIGEKCESLTNERDAHNAMAMLERLSPLVKEMNVKNTVVGLGAKCPPLEILVIAANTIGCQMAEILIALAMAKPVAMPAA